MRLDQIVNMCHELVRLAERIDRDWIAAELADRFSRDGRLVTETCFMVGLRLPKHIYGLSDQGVCDRWVYDRHFQHFTGEEFFQHVFPHERSSLSHWRKRIGGRFDRLLAESLRAAHRTGALNTNELTRITVDITVQPENVTHPTAAKLMLTAIEKTGALAKRHGVALRLSYTRLAKRAVLIAERYPHAKQFKRCHRALKVLRARVGRVIRDTRRKTADDPVLRKAFATPLMRAAQVRSQRQQRRGWTPYSWRAPEVERIGECKAHKPDEFGVKVSIATTSDPTKGGQFVLHAKALPHKPDGRSPARAGFGSREPGPAHAPDAPFLRTASTALPERQPALSHFRGAEIGGREKRHAVQ